MRPRHRYHLQIERLCRKSGVATSTDYRTWLSSDYLLNALAYDPATTTKRLGDGFYEQKLVREQVAQLTGRRFLTGYTNDEAQYQALMNNGITSAKAFKLRCPVRVSVTTLQLISSPFFN